MRKTISSIFAAILLLIAASCTKDILPQVKNETTKTGRTLIASFTANASSTKTALDGLTPKWAVGDKIVLSDGTDDSKEEHMRIFTLKETIGDASTDAQIQSGGTQFLIHVPETFGSTVYAVYPSDAYSGIDNGKPVFEIPQGQYGTFSGANICVAKNEGKTLAFKNATSIIKVSGKSSNVTAIQIANESVSIAGKFTYNFNNGSVTEYASNEKFIISVLPENGPYYIALAPCTLPQGTIFNYKDIESATLGAKATSESKTLEINKIYDIGMALDGVLHGAFTVNEAGKKVYFSKGNLQAYINKSGSPENWRFAPTQTEVLLSGGANTQIGSIAGFVDLFGWSSLKTAFGISMSDDISDYEDNLIDWGIAYCTSNDITPTSTWRTLSSDELKYVLFTRNASTIGETANARFVKTAIDGTKGLLLFPDHFTWVEEMGPEPFYINGNGVTWSDAPTYAMAQFTAMQAGGAVFLPCGGYRVASTFMSDGEGLYWSSRKKDYQQSYTLFFDNANVNIPFQELFFGSSVRLVTE